MNPKTILAAYRLADILCSRIYVSDKAEMHREAGYSYKVPRGEDIMPITLGGTTYRAALTHTQHLLSPLSPAEATAGCISFTCCASKTRRSRFEFANNMRTEQPTAREAVLPARYINVEL